MSFFKKVFNLSSEKPQEKEAKKKEVNLSLDDAFVQNLLEKGGKFLYCTKKEEILVHVEKHHIRKPMEEIELHQHRVKY